jgi:hypothetical protein
LYASDLNETFSAGRVDSLAQAMRNLMELNIWTQYCGLSEENAKRFFDDAARDVRDSFETVQKLYTHVNKEPEKKLDAKLSEMKEELGEGCLSDDCIPVPYRLLVPLTMESTSQSGRKDHFAHHRSMFEPWPEATGGGVQ